MFLCLLYRYLPSMFPFVLYRYFPPCSYVSCIDIHPLCSHCSLIYIHKKGLLARISDHAGWEIPRSAPLQTEDPGEEWYNSAPVWRPENQENQRYELQSEGRCQCNQFDKKGQILLSSTLLCYSDHQQIEQSPPTLERVICFTQSTVSKANLIRQHPHRCTQK